MQRIDLEVGEVGHLCDQAIIPFPPLYYLELYMHAILYRISKMSWFCMSLIDIQCKFLISSFRCVLVAHMPGIKSDTRCHPAPASMQHAAFCHTTAINSISSPALPLQQFFADPLVRTWTFPVTTR